MIPRAPAGNRFVRLRRHRSALVVGAVVVVVTAAGGIAWAAAGGHPAPTTVRPRAEIETLPPSTGSAPTTPTTPTPPGPHTSWPRALAELDAARAEAFAAGDPSGLRRVYAAAPLAAADTALLGRLVPAGCGLRGARTRYTDVVVEHADADRATLLVTATLPPSQLTCAGRVRATAPGAGPTRLRIVLARTAAGPRIAEQSVVR